MHKPTSEDEYFARENAEKLRELAASRRAQLAESEKQHLRELHHHHCPNCGMQMGAVDYRGLKIIRCFGCNGTFLSAGDLDKMAGAEPGGVGVMNDVLRLFDHKKTL